jgi:hypothetical protein
MAKIDDPIGKIRQHSNEPQNPATASVGPLIKYVPVIGHVINAVLERMSGAEKDARLNFLTTAILEQLEFQGTAIDDIQERLEQPNFFPLIAVAIERVLFLANERKIGRFAMIIADAAAHPTTSQEVEDAAFFIKAISELSEDDIRVLSYFYKHQADIFDAGQDMPLDAFFNTARMRVLWEGIAKLNMQPDYFYARCFRLAGYGLMMPLERKIGHGPPDQLFFRITLLGKKLGTLLSKEQP